MSVARRVSVLVLAALLAAATAAADVVTTADEVIQCSVVTCDTSFTRLKLPTGGIRVLYTRDVCEIRLADSSRVAELADQLRQVRVTLELACYAGPLDTVARNASPNEMAAKCRDMHAALLECGQSNDTVAKLLREVNREQAALRRIWPMAGTLGFSGTLGGMLGGPIGALAAGRALDWDERAILGLPYGCAAGCVVGSGIGLAIGAAQQRGILARHRNRVNDLARRVNRAFVTPP